MAKIKIETQVISGMAGPVTYQTKPCPKGFDSKVGSVNCQLCKNFGGIVDDEVECKD